MTAYYEALHLPPFVGRLVKSAQGPGAQFVFSPTRLVQAHLYTAGLQIRCEEAIRIKLPQRCSCGFDVSNKVRTALVTGHLLSCVHNQGFTFTNRHHKIVRAIASVLAAFHLTSVQEPRFLSPTLRPDLYVHAATPIILDITVVDPALNHTVDEIADKRASEKHNKYDSLAERNGAIFFPIVLETYGSLHRECEVFFSLVAREVPEALRPALKRALRTAMQLALVEGNAKILYKAAHRLQEFAASWW
jgi:hypothetical protein